MTKLGLLSSVFLSLSLAGCITDKEVGLETESGEESESAGSSDGSTTDVAPTTGASASGTGSSSSGRWAAALRAKLRASQRGIRPPADFTTPRTY